MYYTVTINSVIYDVYASNQIADDYMGAQISSAGTAWRAATEDEQNRALVSATRLINRQTWQGTRDDQYYPLAFPRSGLLDADGAAVDSSIVPQQVIDACCELAASLLDGSTVQDQSTTENNTQSLSAGSVSISYFRPTSEVSGRFPQVVQELLGLWLSSSASVIVGFSSGTDEESAFKSSYDFNEGF